MKCWRCGGKTKSLDVDYVSEYVSYEFHYCHRCKIFWVETKTRSDGEDWRSVRTTMIDENDPLHEAMYSYYRRWGVIR